MHYTPNLRRSVSIAIMIVFFLPNVSFSQQFQDCYNAFPVCNKQTYSFENMKGFGNEKDKFPILTCSEYLNETNSIWLKFTIKKNGIITFFIDPVNETNDIDFVLFKKINKDCENLQEVRCMAAGQTVGQSNSINEICKGSTGLSYQSIDEFESSGCKYESDNFLKYLSAVEEEEYFLMVNNYDSNEGFSISFDGDAEFVEFNDCLKYNIEQPLSITSIVPNPAKSYIDINLKSLQDESILFEIFSLDGRRQIKKTVQSKARDQVYRLDIDALSVANYLVRLTQGNYSTIRQFSKI